MTNKFGAYVARFHCFRASLIATRTTPLKTYLAERSAGAPSSTSVTVAQTVQFALRFSVLFSAPRKPLPEDFSQSGRESGAVVGVADLSQRFGLCRVRMDGVRQCAHFQSVRDRQRQFADHLAGVARDNRSAEDFSRPAVVMDSRESVFFSIENRPVNVFKALRDRRHVEAGRARLILVKTCMRDFRIGINHPGHDHCGRPRATEE